MDTFKTLIYVTYSFLYNSNYCNLKIINFKVKYYHKKQKTFLGLCNLKLTFNPIILNFSKHLLIFHNIQFLIAY